MSSLNRGGFASRIGFILAAAGSAVGLGNIWKFPYEAGKHGGAAFLVVYILLTFLFCYPIMVGEIAIGRKAGKDVFGSYKLLGGKRWGFLGLLGILCGVMILSFYNVVAGWAFGYFLEISFGRLLDHPDYTAFFKGYTANIWDNLLYSMGFMMITALIISRGVQKGIEAASKIMMPTFLILLLFLIGYSITLPNAMAGIEFYLVPDFTKINADTIYTAMGHAFFSLSLGMGALITYGSYVEKHQNIIKSSVTITFMDMSIAFLSGLMIFPLVFSQEVAPGGGPALVFIVLPGIFKAMGAIGPFIGATFFLLLCFAALTSTISLLEVPVAYFVDEKKLPRKTMTWIMAAIIFIVGLPSMLSQGAAKIFSELSFYTDVEGKPKSTLDFVAELFSELFLPLGGCLMCIFIVFQWGKNRMSAEIEEGNAGYTGSFLEKYINFTITYICPVVLGVFTVMLLLDKLFKVNILSLL